MLVIRQPDEKHIRLELEAAPAGVKLVAYDNEHQDRRMPLMFFKHSGIWVRCVRADAYWLREAGFAFNSKGQWSNMEQM